MKDASHELLTQNDLWAGIYLKLEHASFHLEGMGKALQPPEQTHHNVVLESAGVIIGGNWGRAFYAHLDAFLSACYSVPELIRCCFGVDGHPRLKPWFESRDRDEQERRRDFGAKFKPDFDAFRALSLTTARHLSAHRTGVPQVTVTVTGRFGITYIGNPTKPIPISETRELPPEYAWMAKPTPIRPMWTNFFDSDGKLLFETCRDYLDRALALADRAQALAQQVHGDGELTQPPTDM